MFSQSFGNEMCYLHTVSAKYDCVGAARQGEEVYLAETWMLPFFGSQIGEMNVTNPAIALA